MTPELSTGFSTDLWFVNPNAAHITNVPTDFPGSNNRRWAPGQDLSHHFRTLQIFFLETITYDDNLIVFIE